MSKDNQQPSPQVDGWVTKRCSKCGVVKAAHSFERRADRSGKLRTVCTPCRSLRKKMLYPKNREKVAVASRKWRLTHPGRIQEMTRARTVRLRAEVFAGYGGCCRCCGKAESDFLTLDHVNNDGARHREQLFGSPRVGGGSTFYRWIIDHNFPALLQLLCGDCHVSKTRNRGTCIHQLRKGSTTSRYDVGTKRLGVEAPGPRNLRGDEIV